MKKRVLALLLAVCMAFGLVSVAGAEAASGADGAQLCFRKVDVSDENGPTILDDIYTEFADYPGYVHFVQFCCGKEDDCEPLAVADVEFTPDEGASEDAVYCWYEDEYGWCIYYHLPGTGTITVTTEDGTTCSAPCAALMPAVWFFSRQEYCADAYLGEFDYDVYNDNIIYLMCEDGFTAAMLSNGDVELTMESDKISDPVQSEYFTTENVLRPGTTDRYDVKVTILQCEPDYGYDINADVEFSETDKYYFNLPVQAQYSSTAVKLATPTDLTWNGTDYTEYGLMGVKCTSPTQYCYEWSIYRVGDDEPLMKERWYYSGTEELEYAWGYDFIYGFSSEAGTNEWVELPEGCDDYLFATGDYYFTVQSMADDINFRDSDVATSPVWHYEKPDTYLDTPTNLRWNGICPCWDEPNGGEDVAYYIIDFYTHDGEEVGYCCGSMMNTLDSMTDEFVREYIYDVLKDSDCTGLTFRVRAVSTDITAINNSLWSGYGPVLDVSGISWDVNGTLDELLDSDDVQEIRDTLARNAEELIVAMGADRGEEDGTIAKLTALEERAGGPAEVDVSGDLSGNFDSGKVTIVGANLNNVDEGGATLQIGKADENVVIPELYESTLQFSMQLDGAEDADPATAGQQLSVPVCITLPIPANINPDFLVILHFHQDGKYDQIIPYIYQEGGQWYASFVVTSFSDFAFVQERVTLSDDGSTLTVRDLDGAETVMAAVYDKNGKMLACVTAAVADGTDSVSLDLPQVADGAKVKVFTLDGSSRPVRGAVTLDLTK